MSDKIQKKCFIIMPFSETKSHDEEYWTVHFEKYLKPIIEEVEGVEVFRSQPFRGAITSEIVLNLIKSDIVVADLTDHNPNVFWELGVRHSFKHGTITIAERGTKIPFDIKDKGVLFYAEHHLDNEFREILKKAIKDCCENPEGPDSPILVEISGKGTLYSLINEDENKRKIIALKKEYEINNKHLEQIYGQLLENKANPEERQYNTRRLLYSSVELLVTNRYLDKKDSFYDVVLEFFNEIIIMNAQMNEWMINYETFEGWLELSEAGLRDLYKRYKEELDSL